MHYSKGVQKNILTAWNFAKNKFRQRCFDNLLKSFGTNILENATRDMLSKVTLMVG